MNQDRITWAKRRSLMLRLHLWAALIASPFAIVAALTGLLYVVTPQVEAALYDQLDHVTPAGAQRPLDEVVQAARAAAPSGLDLRSVAVPVRDDESVRVTFSPPRAQRAGLADPHARHGSSTPANAHAGHGAHPHGTAAPNVTAMNAVAAPLPSPFGDRLPRGVVVYVDPYSGAVLGSQPELQRFNVWTRRLHSSLLQGDGWRWPIELAASWLMVMLLTGVYLWWPRGGERPLPEASARARFAWRRWHALAGVCLSVLSLAMLTTGLTWSRYAGDEIRTLRDAAGQASPTPPRTLQSAPPHGQALLAWDAVLRAARQQAPEVALQIMPPQGERGIWRVSAVDRGEPLGRFTLALDAYSGEKLFYAGWERQTAFGKATAVGIPFHRGELGWWNQALLFLFGAGVLFSMVSGWVVCFKRVRQVAPLLPRVAPGAWRAMPIGAWVAALALLALMPLLAASVPLLAAAEAVLAWRRRDAQIVAA